jgi:Flp pilus assembly protein TadD
MTNIARPSDIAPETAAKRLRRVAGLVERGALDAAAEAVGAVLAEGPSAEAFRLLGQIRRRQGQLPASVSAFLEALSLEPEDAESFFELGGVLHRLGRFDGAVEALGQAARLAPENPEVWHNLGQAFSSDGKAAEAVDCLGRAADLAPDNADFHRAFAILLRSLGRSAEAVESFENALRVRPGDAVALMNLAGLGRIPADDPRVGIMQAMLASEQVPARDRVDIGNALFRIHDKAGAHGKAFACLETANRLQHALLPFDPAIEHALFRRMADVFTADFFARMGVGGFAESAPIFIVGMPRSGTTLVERILAAHPEVEAGGEAIAITDLVRRFLIDPATGAMRLDEADFTPDNRLAMGRFYVDAMRKVAAGGTRFTDKMPLNFRWIGVISAILPNARFVHCRRDPVENCFSLYSSFFPSGGNRYSYDLDDLARYYVDYHRLMQHWQGVLGERILSVGLEDMVADQDKETRRLLAFAGLDFDPACLAFHDSAGAVTTLSQDQVRRPIFGGHGDRVRPYLGFLEPLIARLRAADLA